MTARSSRPGRGGTPPAKGGGGFWSGLLGVMPWQFWAVIVGTAVALVVLDGLLGKMRIFGPHPVLGLFTPVLLPVALIVLAIVALRHREAIIAAVQENPPLIIGGAIAVVAIIIIVWNWGVIAPLLADWWLIFTPAIAVIVGWFIVRTFRRR